jgi:hypothetical protein
MAKYEYEQHPHATTRHQTHPGAQFKAKAQAQTKRKPKGRMSLNDRVGLGITKTVGTMWAAYVFFALTLVSLPAALASGNALVIVSWIAQTFLQLVLLPVIIVGQNIQAREAEKRAIATYDDATAILEESKQIQVHLAEQDAALDKLIKDLARVEKHVKK